jgi:cell division protein FtsI/penicillin-binding protein 2
MVVDETLLARHYPLGDLVSHVVGYVGPVITEDLRMTRRRASLSIKRTM